MTTASHPAEAYEPRAASSAPLPPKRPFYWSVRREIWEHRSIYLAPLIVAGLVLLSFLIRIRHLPETVRTIALQSEAKQYLELAAPYGLAALSKPLFPLATSAIEPTPTNIHFENLSIAPSAQSGR